MNESNTVLYWKVLTFQKILKNIAQKCRLFNFWPLKGLLYQLHILVMRHSRKVLSSGDIWFLNTYIACMKWRNKSINDFRVIWYSSYKAVFSQRTNFNCSNIYIQPRLTWAMRWISISLIQLSDYKYKYSNAKYVSIIFVMINIVLYFFSIA